MTDNLPEPIDIIDAEIVDVYTEYDSNNSGGSFWLSDQNWADLEKAGWVISNHFGSEPTAAKRKLPIGLAIQEWAEITGMDPSDEGCNCCGPPHSFIERDADGKLLRSMDIITETSWEIS